VKVSGRAWGGAILFALFVHVACSAAAIGRYPGGTWCDRGSDGHSLWANFLCDLLHAHALNGQENPGAGLARVSMLALIAAFALFWASVGRGAVPTLGSRVLSVAASLSVLGMIAVPLLASDRFPRGHGAAVMLAGGPGFLAMSLSVMIVFRQGQRTLGSVGALAILISIVDMALYVKSYFGSGDCVPLLPVLQRIALVLVLGFLAGVAVRSFETDQPMR
jgi:hypothetical protein